MLYMLTVRLSPTTLSDPTLYCEQGVYSIIPTPVEVRSGTYSSCFHDENCVSVSHPYFTSRRFGSGVPPSDIHVYSDPELIPPGESAARLCQIGEGMGLSTFYREAFVDLRDTRPIHSLSEGRASALVEERAQRMLELLKPWRAEHPLLLKNKAV